jgi:hypothetical protein
MPHLLENMVQNSVALNDDDFWTENIRKNLFLKKLIWFVSVWFLVKSFSGLFHSLLDLQLRSVTPLLEKFIFQTFKFNYQNLWHWCVKDPFMIAWDHFKKSKWLIKEVIELDASFDSTVITFFQIVSHVTHSASDFFHFKFIFIIICIDYLFKFLKPFLK